METILAGTIGTFLFTVIFSTVLTLRTWKEDPEPTTTRLRGEKYSSPPLTMRAFLSETRNFSLPAALIFTAIMVPIWTIVEVIQHPSKWPNLAPFLLISFALWLLAKLIKAI